METSVSRGRREDELDTIELSDGLGVPEPAPVNDEATAPARRLDISGICVWGLSAGLVFYLALSGGGYDPVIRNQVGMVVWWVILLGAIAGVLPAHRVSRSAWVGVGLLAALTVWSTLAITWSHSGERALQEASRLACYLGILLLAVFAHRNRERAVRLVVGALGFAITAVAVLALVSRLRPGTFPAATQTAAFLPGTRGRLDWPLGYWNALAALLALNLPLLLAIASTARRLAVRALAAAVIPLVVLAGYLTFSRGGVVAAVVAVTVFLILDSDRLQKVATVIVSAGASAVLLVEASQRSAIENGLTGALARHQGRQLMVLVALVCIGTGLIQVAIAAVFRRAGNAGRLRVSPQRSRWILAAAVIVAITVALAAGAPSRVSRAWHDFKRPTATALDQNAAGRFGSTSGNGRYAYWKLALDQSGAHVVGGWGPGTFQMVWLARGPYYSYVENAHSLYFETLLEDGLVGAALVVAFIGCVLVTGARAALSRRAARDSNANSARTLTAAAAAACAAFATSAALDWVWQIPVLPVCFLLLAAALFAPPRAGVTQADSGGDVVRRTGWRLVATRAALVATAVAALVVIVIPLQTTDDLRRSQNAAARNDFSRALRYARAAAQMEPSAASPQIQIALVEELAGDLGPAVDAARQATRDEPMNWSAWLIRFRLEAENGRPAAALQALRQAQALNPRSPLFTHSS